MLWASGTHLYSEESRGVPWNSDSQSVVSGPAASVSLVDYLKDSVLDPFSDPLSQDFGR